MTTGPAIVGALLSAHAPLVQKVPVGAMKMGRLDATVLPGLLLRSISLVHRQTLKRAGWERRTERVAVTVRAASYRDMVLILGRVHDACTDRVGDIAGAERVAVLSAGMGPEVTGPGDSHERTHDFRVSYDAPISNAGE